MARMALRREQQRCEASAERVAQLETQVQAVQTEMAAKLRAAQSQLEQSRQQWGQRLEQRELAIRAANHEASEVRSWQSGLAYYGELDAPPHEAITPSLQAQKRCAATAAQRDKQVASAEEAYRKLVLMARAFESQSTRLNSAEADLDRVRGAERQARAASERDSQG